MNIMIRHHGVGIGNLIAVKSATHRMIDLSRRTCVNTCQATLFNHGQERRKAISFHRIEQMKATLQTCFIDCGVNAF